jgi:hypothetical protein
LAGTSVLSFEARADTKATPRKRQIREKISRDKKEAKNILKKLLIFFLILSKIKEFGSRSCEHYTNPLFIDSNSLLTPIDLT